MHRLKANLLEVLSKNFHANEYINIAISYIFMRVYIYISHQLDNFGMHLTKCVYISHYRIFRVSATQLLFFEMLCYVMFVMPKTTLYVKLPA